MYVIMAWHFLIWYFFKFALTKSRSIFALGSSLSPCKSISMLLIHSAFLLCWLRSHILLQNCFASFAFILLICFNAFSPYLLVEFSFVVLECPVLSVFFGPISVFSFANTFWFISSSVLFLLIVLFFSFHPDISSCFPPF